MSTGHFVKTFACMIDLGRLIADLAADGAGQHMSVDKCRRCVAMGRRPAPGRITHHHGNYPLSFDVRECVLEDESDLVPVLRDGGRTSKLLLLLPAGRSAVRIALLTAFTIISGGFDRAPI